MLIKFFSLKHSSSSIQNSSKFCTTSLETPKPKCIIVNFLTQTSMRRLFTKGTTNSNCRLQSWIKEYVCLSAGAPECL